MTSFNSPMHQCSRVVGLHWFTLPVLHQAITGMNESKLLIRTHTHDNLFNIQTFCVWNCQVYILVTINLTNFVQGIYGVATRLLLCYSQVPPLTGLASTGMKESSDWTGLDVITTWIIYIILIKWICVKDGMFQTVLQILKLVVSFCLHMFRFILIFIFFSAFLKLNWDRQNMYA